MRAAGDGRAHFLCPLAPPSRFASPASPNLACMAYIEAMSPGLWITRSADPKAAIAQT
jgi:hypothetical protein